MAPPHRFTVNDREYRDHPRSAYHPPINGHNPSHANAQNNRPPSPSAMTFWSNLAKPRQNSKRSRHTQPPPQPSLPQRPPPPVPLSQRLARLNSTLSTIQHSLSNRNDLVHLSAQHPHAYKPHLPANRAWAAAAARDLRIFEDLCREMESADAATQEARIDMWEEAVEKLRLGTLNQSEKVDERGQWDSVWWRARPGIFKEGWG